MFCAALVLLMLAVTGHGVQDVTGLGDPISCFPSVLTRFHTRIMNRPHNLFRNNRSPPHSFFDPLPVDILDLCATSEQLQRLRPERGTHRPGDWRAGLECIDGRLNNKRNKETFDLIWAAYEALPVAQGGFDRSRYLNARLEEQRVFMDMSNFCKLQCWCDEEAGGRGEDNGGGKKEEDKFGEELEALLRMPVPPRLPDPKGLSENGLNPVQSIAGSAQTDIGVGVHGAAGLAKRPTGADAALGLQQSANRRESRRKAGLSNFPLGTADAAAYTHNFGMSRRKAGLIDILAHEALAGSTLGRRKQK